MQSQQTISSGVDWFAQANCHKELAELMDSHRTSHDAVDSGQHKRLVMNLSSSISELASDTFVVCFALVWQVLKAIGLQRTGKQDEAFTLAQEAAILEPTDDNSLQALTILYREMHRRECWKHRQRTSS